MTTPAAPEPAAPKPDDTLASLLERVNKLEEATRVLATAAEVTGHGFIQMGSHIDALAARVTALEDQPEPEPDLYAARRGLNTASKDDRPQALANLNAAKVRIRRQAFTAADLETPDWCAACGNIAVAWPGVVCDICQNEAKS